MVAAPKKAVLASAANAQYVVNFTAKELKMAPERPATNQSADQPGPSLASTAFGYIFVGILGCWYWAQATLVGQIVSGALILFSVIELAGAFSHFVLHYITFWGQVVVSSLLFATAIILILHHRRLTIRIARYDGVLGYMGGLLEDESGRAAGGHRRSHVDGILNALVFAVKRYGNGHANMYATVLMQDQAGGDFKIAFQDGQNTFAEGTCLDCRESAASSVTQRPCGTLLYVPYTRFRHGIKIVREDMITARPAGSHNETFAAIEIIPNVFQVLDKENQQAVRSLLCVQVPLGNDHQRTGPRGEKAVLCLSSDRTGRMQHIEFTAIKLAASLVSFVLKDPKVLVAQP